MSTSASFSLSGCLLLAAGCTYLDTPEGRYLNINLPLESRHTVHKTVHIHAPPGTTVIYGDRDAYPDAAQAHTHSAHILLRSETDGNCIEAGIGYLNTAPCHGRPSQRFALSGQHLRTAGGLCIDTEHGRLQAGTRLTAALCRQRPSQQWHSDGSRLFNRAARLCFDLPRPGSPLVLSPCNGSSGQRFFFTRHPY